MTFQLMYQPLFITPPPSPPPSSSPALFGVPNGGGSDSDDLFSRRRGSSVELKMTATTTVTTMSASPLSQPSRDFEAEIIRLKLELKQTMDMYSMACKEAITAKRKAEQLHQMKLEEERRLEEARMAEESALAIAEMEKAKCKAAIDAAEKAQRLAEMEAQRRRHAEIKARQEAQEKDRVLTALHQNDARYRKYSIEDIEAAIKVLRPDAAPEMSFISYFSVCCPCLVIWALFLYLLG